MAEDAADYVGIRMNNGDIDWNTIFLIINSTQINLTNATSDKFVNSAADIGNAVVTYTNKSERPLDFFYANRRDVNGIDTPIDLIGEVEYRQLSIKSSSGPPNLAYYQPTLDNGTLFVWPTDGGLTWDRILLQGRFLVDDFDTTADEPEFPIEWTNALIFQLAHDISHEYGVSEKKQGRLYLIAQKKLNDLLDYDQETASVRFALGQQAGRQ